MVKPEWERKKEGKRKLMREPRCSLAIVYFQTVFLMPRLKFNIKTINEVNAAWDERNVNE